jgi:hypothetical protein
MTLSSFLRVDLPSDLMPSNFPIKILYAHIFLTRATYPDHIPLHHLITQIMFHEEHKSRMSSVCSFLQSLVSSS